MGNPGLCAVYLFAVAISLAGCVSLSAEGQMNEKTLCPAAVSAFDGKDLPQMQEFLRFVQNVFDELDARSRKGRACLKAKLIDMSVEGSVVLALPPASNGNDLRSDSGRLSRLEDAAQAHDRYSRRETAAFDRGQVSLPIVLARIDLALAPHRRLRERP